MRASHGLTTCRWTCLLFVALGVLSAPVAGQTGKATSYDDLLVDATPVASGTGVVFLEPVSSGTDEASMRFGAGCSRWMQVVVGGHGQMGKNPAWSFVAEPDGGANAASLRLDQKAAARVAALLGVTHYVIPELRGADANLEVRYKVFAVGGQGEPIGAVAVSGGETRILAGLPAAAEKIAFALGVSAPRVPAACAVDAKGMRLLGKLDRCPASTASADDVKQLTQLARQEAVAAVMLLEAHASVPADDRAAAQATLKAIASDNALACYTLVSTRTSADPQIDALAQRIGAKHPNSFLAVASCYEAISAAGENEKSLALAEHLPRCAPRSPRGWLTYARALADAAQGIRNARVTADLTADERKVLYAAYAVWTAAAKRCTDLAPDYLPGQLELSKAACFGSDLDLAHPAFEKALRLDPNNHDVLWWGLEMYQPKWGGTQADLDRVVDAAVHARYASGLVAMLAAEHVATVDERYRPAYETLCTKADAQAREELKRNPDDMPAHQTVATIAQWHSRFPEAIEHILAVARLVPKPKDQLLRAAKLTRATTDPKANEAVLAELRKATQKDPGDVDLKLALAEALGQGRHREEQEQALRAAVRDHPTDLNAKRQLAMFLRDAKKADEAAKLADEILKAEPNDPAAQTIRITALTAAKRYDEAIALLRVRIRSQNMAWSERQQLVDVLRSKGDYRAAVDELHQMMALNPHQTSNAAYSGQLGECYVALNERAEAIKAFQFCILNGPELPEADNARAALKRLGEAAPQLAADYVPQNAEAAISAISLMGGNKAAIVSMLRQAHAKWPENARVTAALGDRLWYDGDKEESLKLLREAFAKGGRQLTGYSQLQNHLTEAKRYDELVDLHKTMANLVPEFPGVKGRIVDALTMAGRLDEAIAACQEALKAEPKNAGLHRMLAACHMGKKDYTAALAEWNAALGLSATDSERAGSRLGLGRTYEAMGKRLEAIKEWQAAIDAEPRGYYVREAQQLLVDAGVTPPSGQPGGESADPVVRLQRATSLLYSGKLDEADAEVKELGKVMPNEPEFHRLAGLLLKRRGKPAEAEAEFKQALGGRPNDTSLMLEVASALRSQGKQEESYEWYRKAAKLAPANPTIHAAFAQALLTARKIDEAIVEAKAEADCAPNEAVHRLNLVNAYHAKGDHEGVAREARLCAQYASDPSLRAFYLATAAQALWQLGRKDEARRTMQGALVDATGAAKTQMQQTLELWKDRPADPPPAQTPATPAAPGAGASPAAPPATKVRTAVTVPDRLIEAEQLVSAGKFDDAGAALEELRKLAPAEPSVHRITGLLHARRGDNAKAEAELRLAFAAMLKDTRVVNELADALVAQSKDDEAFAVYRKGLQASPDGKAIRGNFAQRLINKRRFDEAVTVAKPLVDADPKDVMYRLLLVGAYEGKGDSTAAVRELRLCLKHNTFATFVSMLHWRLGNALWKLGQKEEARGELQEALKSADPSNKAMIQGTLDSWK